MSKCKHNWRVSHWWRHLPLRPILKPWVLARPWPRGPARWRRRIAINPEDCSEKKPFKYDVTNSKWRHAIVYNCCPPHPSYRFLLLRLCYCSSQNHWPPPSLDRDVFYERPPMKEKYYIIWEKFNKNHLHHSQLRYLRCNSCLMTACLSHIKAKCCYLKK